MSEVHGLRRPDARLGPVVPVALQLLRVRLLLPAEEQGPGVPVLRQGLQALGAKGDDAVRQLQEVSDLSLFSIHFWTFSLVPWERQEMPLFFLSAAQPTDQGEESVLLLLVVVVGGDHFQMSNVQFFEV